jgi:hypothetical protein
MSLSDFQIETAAIIRGSSSFSVRGLSADDVQAILARVRNSLELIFNLAEKEGISSLGNVTQDKLRRFLVSAIKEFPIVIAMIIAQATGELDEYEVAKSLPIQIQIEALEKISALTFGDATNFGAFSGKVQAVIQMVMTGLNQKKPPKTSLPPTAGIEA